MLEQLVFSYEPRIRNTIVTIGSGIADKYQQRGFALLLDEQITGDVAAALESMAAATWRLAGGETVKAREHVAWVQDKLIERGFGADSHLVVVGGGTLLDLGGFVAATYCRGIGYTAIPTTVLAMVDAGIGGKNGINARGVKNIIGTIYQPDEVLIDIDFLRTLPPFEIQNGLIEMIKHELLAGDKKKAQMVASVCKENNPGILVNAIKESITIKGEIIKRSLQVNGVRDLLNFGHTIGHAIEALEGFSIAHGQAVAMGMMAECRLGALPQEDITFIDQLIRNIGLPLRLSRRYSLEQWHACLRHDKKALQQRPRFVLLDAIGAPRQERGAYCHEVAPDKVNAVIEWLQKWAV